MVKEKRGDKGIVQRRRCKGLMDSQRGDILKTWCTHREEMSLGAHTDTDTHIDTQTITKSRKTGESES